MHLLTVQVQDPSIAEKRGYVYVVAVPGIRVLYVGQTRNSLGALGRLAQHLSSSSSSTLRSRVERHLGFEPWEWGSVHFAAFPLEMGGKSDGDSAVYREAVEALVQASLLNFLSSERVALVVLSHVERNGYMTQLEVVASAKRVGDALKDWVRSIV